MKVIKPQHLTLMKLERAIKKPLVINCVQIHESFIVETLEGKLKGKKGDWLMIGVRGEMYPCDNEIFKETYDLVN